MLLSARSLFLTYSKNNCRYLITSKMDCSTMIKDIKKFIPSLDSQKHKGQAGRIAIIGGSLEYTGAPYFSGISALKVGADLVHIFCAKTAASVIKSYSPELIVHPLLDVPNGVDQIKPWLDRIHVLVIGPGLGRETHIFNVVSEIIHYAADKRIPLIIDADGLYLITENLQLIKTYPLPGVVLTPNKIEFERLYPKIKHESALCTEDNINIDYEKLGDNVTILKKGNPDEVFSRFSQLTWKSNVGGSGRRCGGQGDLLSGSIATFLHWAINNVNKADEIDNYSYAASLSCYAASRMVRLCNEKAFEKKGRSMLATDMIEYIHPSFEELFGM